MASPIVKKEIEKVVRESWIYSARIRLGVAIIVGLLAAWLSLYLGSSLTAPLIGWDAFVLVYIIWVGCTVFRLPRNGASSLATSEDPDRITSDLLLIVASIASLIGVGSALIQAGSGDSSAKWLLVSLGVASVILSWALVHTVFALRYARLYYAAPKGGIDFNSDKDPDYMEFAYLAFTIGMTYQVSDTAVAQKKIRNAVIRHALLSYLFGTVIVAITINLVAGLGK